MRRLATSSVLTLSLALFLAAGIAACTDLTVSEEGVIGEHGVAGDTGGDVPGSGGAVDEAGLVGEHGATGPVIAEEKDATGPIIVGEADATGPVIVDNYGTVDVAEALNHVGETATVRGVVVAVDDFGPKYEKYVISLDSEQDGQGFNILIRYENAAKFDWGGISTRVGETVHVTGEIYLNTSQQKGEIEVTDPSQLEYPVGTFKPEILD